MKPEFQDASGSMFWQMIFVSFAVVLLLFELVRGWRLGLMRQLARIFAVAAAYATAIFGGRLLVPVARPFLKMPDPAIAIVAGAILALLVYSIISSVGRILFKRTNQQNSAPMRFLSGASGAAVGLLFGAFLVWVMIVSIRSLGSIADGEVRTREAVQPTHAPRAEQTVASPSSQVTTEEPTQVMAILARLKNSIELGSVGDIVKRTDLVPEQTYDTLAKAGQMLANPQSAERFLNFPGARELSENPKIVALRNDPEIAELIAHGRIFDLLQNEKVLDAANDPALVAKIKQFDVRRALDYATTGKR